MSAFETAKERCQAVYDVLMVALSLETLTFLRCVDGRQLLDNPIGRKLGIAEHIKT